MAGVGADQAAEIYSRLVTEGQIPDLGEAFDEFQGKGPDGSTVVALFFRD